MDQHHWPVLDFTELKDSIATVHLWLQIVGKIRLRQTPWTNHSWHSTLYISPRGLTTGSIPYKSNVFQVDFDFINHKLIITTNSGVNEAIELYPRTVASFYNEVFDKLKSSGIDITIYSTPNEIENAIPFKEDEIHKSYNKERIHDLWQALIKIQNVFIKFRAGFKGKCSPVHLFWGAFDLAVTRFSGRTAPKHPGGMPNIPLNIMQEAYSHEVSSCGFWPGSEDYPNPLFYSYCYPTPPEFQNQPVKPNAAFYSQEMGEFLLHYDKVRGSANPEETLMEFLATTYEAAANTLNWDRSSLEFSFSIK